MAGIHPKLEQLRRASLDGNHELVDLLLGEVDANLADAAAAIDRFVERQGELVGSMVAAINGLGGTMEMIRSVAES